MMGGSWIVCGASTSAGRYLPVARARRAAAITIAANSAYWLFVGHRLDYWMIHDSASCRNYREASKEQQKTGTTIVTLRRKPQALVERGIDHADVFLELDHGIPPTQYVVGRFTSVSFTGLHALQFALSHKPEEVHLVGMEGYRSTEQIVPEYFDGRMGWENAIRKSLDCLGPFTRSCVAACAGTSFVFYGKPIYEVGGPNVTIET